MLKEMGVTRLRESIDKRKPIIRTYLLSDGTMFQFKDYDGLEPFKPIERILMGIIDHHWGYYKIREMPDWLKWKEETDILKTIVGCGKDHIEFVFSEGVIVINRHNGVDLKVGREERYVLDYLIGNVKLVPTIFDAATKSFANYGQRALIFKDRDDAKLARKENSND